MEGEQITVIQVERDGVLYHIWGNGDVKIGVVEVGGYGNMADLLGANKSKVHES